MEVATVSYNGSGTFQINTSGQPVVTGTVISSTAFNSLTSDLATGLSTAITKDGQTTTTARITFAQGITSSLVTDSSSVSTGSIITAGGAGIAKNLYVGGIASFSAQPIFTSLTASSAVATDASKGLVSVTNTGTGNNVLATSPTIATPTISSLSSASATALTLQSAGTTAITVDTSQNVGIGTTSPSTYGKLAVYGTNAGGDIAAKIVNSSTSASSTTSLILSDTTGALVKLVGDNAGSVSSLKAVDRNTLLSFWTGASGGAEAMRINSSGAVSIGTTSSGSKLTVVDSTTTTGYNFDVQSTTATYSGSFARYQLTQGATSSVEVWRVFMGAGATEIVRVSGNGTFGSATGVYGTVSDIKLKENIVDTTPKLDKLMQVRVVNYNLKAETGHVTHKQLGFVAQELEQVFPGLVEDSPDKDNDGNSLGTITKRVKLSVFIPMLVKAIQEQQTIIESLTARITALENR